ncbi:alpha/beta hydrolase fold protein [Hyphomicrobium denitrificans ATCC 51888]|uniref:Alpha/beta hydrolase fold protein n=1 Tax=Hyphomicrobium denitrificans (strain ATCC 51888 / DSM 1869 / NCIMB 11706 / TK 0415) TaxID=582899 RepID=D8JQQ5_HYPDA|nr:alpha/beta fold hydrolase [Hyphomicrobium denitrificans]ADJ22057.1 alpha/beta hydrolase fold protein [Hyphomicrobium denitrificans ATCC 51888]
MRSLSALLVSFFIAAMFAGPAMSWSDEDVTRDGLHGSLIVPYRGARSATVLILAGSGPVDRDGNLPGLRNDGLKLLARGLAERGIASLRIDKRGIGQSRTAAMREEDLRIQTYVDDAIGWMALLRARQDTGPIFILGHSEGALIATLAAQRVDVAGVILVAGAGEPAAALIGRQLSDAGVPEHLQTESKRISQSLARGVAVADVPLELTALYRASVQPYLMSWLQLDPATELARVKAPALIVQGTHDLQIRVEDAQRLAAGQPNSKLVSIEAMNHVLREAPKERAANLAIYGAFDQPLAPELVPAIASFIEAHAR